MFYILKVIELFSQQLFSITFNILIQKQDRQMPADNVLKISAHTIKILSRNIFDYAYVILEHVNSLFGIFISKECDIFGRDAQ